MKKFLLSSAILILSFTFLTSAESIQLYPGKKSTWKGFDRYDFLYRGRSCRLVCPRVPADGNPWIWNARFPDWHTDTDSILLAAGFHVTYINTDEFNGAPGCVKIWDQYFRYLTDSLHLENRVALEGISRGGLYVYNFAKKYPWRISSIYCEAPVCDIKSWPGGMGKGDGSKPDWQLVLKAYGFASEQEAVAYADNPVDNLEALAAEKVPVLHMVGINDSIVPPEENSYILINKYIRLGGPATVIPCTRNLSLRGHHFDIETPEMVAEFIKQNTRAFREELSCASYRTTRDGISNTAQIFNELKKGTVAFLGGSITHNNGWRDSVCQSIRKRFPDTEFEFINAGIPSLGSLPDAFRAYNDIFSKSKPDLLFVEAAVNDRTNAYNSESRVRSMEGIVRQAKKVNPECDIVFMYFADPDKISDYNNGKIPSEIADHEKVAAHYGIPSVNLAKEVTERINNREFSWKGDFVDLHPSKFGQGVYARSIIDLLLDEWNSESRTSPKAVKHNLPAPLDPFCYDKGRLLQAADIGNINGWTADLNWIPADKAGTREGYVRVPMLVSESPGKVLRFTFRGKVFGIAVASGPDAGIIEYSIDGKEWRNTDLFTQWSSSLHLPWFITLADGLADAKHTLRIRLSQEKNPASKGTACRIRYFYVNE